MTNTPENTQALVAKLAQSVDLTDIKVIAFTARLLRPAPATSSQLAGSVTSKLQTASLPDGFVVECRFKFQAKSKEDDKVFLDLGYRIGATYRTRQPLPSTEVLQAFAATNGMIHLWPYFRAYVQSSCGELAVPAAILPPFRVTRKQPEPASTTEP